MISSLEWAQRVAGLTCSAAVCRWMGTLDIRSVDYDSTADMVSPDYTGQAIFIFWHEYILIPFYLRSRCRATMLLSRHSDAQWLYHTARFMGLHAVRGSSRRGGSAALIELMHAARDMNVIITPDGPRGPRRQLAPGAIYLSSKLGLPLIAAGFGCDRPWRMPTWDQFAVPRLYSRVRVVLGPRLHIPPRLDRDGVEHYRGEVERLLNRLTDEAEQWAASGRGKADQRVVRRQLAPRRATPVVPAVELPRRRRTAA